jgi:hypothetical protein
MSPCRHVSSNNQGPARLEPLRPQQVVSPPTLENQLLIHDLVLLVARTNETEKALLVKLDSIRNVVFELALGTQLLVQEFTRRIAASVRTLQSTPKRFIRNVGRKVSLETFHSKRFTRNACSNYELVFRLL